MAGLIATPLAADDANFAEEQVAKYFGSNRVVSRGRLYHCDALPGLIAWHDGRRVGLLQYYRHEADFEVVTLVSCEPGMGIGRFLLGEIAALANHEGASRCWLITTNNNRNAIAFYKAVGWHHVATHDGAVDAARRIKPEIPLVDDMGVPIRDELEFELQL